MKSGLVLVALAACGGRASQNPFGCDLCDAPPHQADADLEEDFCNLLAQAGCGAGEKCTWKLATTPTADAPGLGAIGCAAAGDVAIGGACTIASVGHPDNCRGGGYCLDNVCQQICDNNGGTPGCASGSACVTFDGIFANEGSTTTPAGLCQPTCDPLDDNDFDGSGTRFTKIGSGCGSDPTIGCYGVPGFTATTFFTCSKPATGTEQLTHRSMIPGSQFFVSDCMSGYSIAFASDATGSNNIDCYAFCKPGDAYLGNPNPQLPNGVSPHACNTTDALGNFGDIPDGGPTSNGEHCVYSWYFETDPTTGAVHHSPTSDTIGYCFDHSKYKYDPTGGANATTIVPPCAALPLAKAVQFGCVSTATAGLFAMPRRAANLPELLQHPSLHHR
jgi:hypothetical protein